MRGCGSAPGAAGARGPPGYPRTAARPPASSVTRSFGAGVRWVPAPGVTAARRPGPPLPGPVWEMGGGEPRRKAPNVGPSHPVSAPLPAGSLLRVLLSFVLIYLLSTFLSFSGPHLLPPFLFPSIHLPLDLSPHFLAPPGHSRWWWGGGAQWKGTGGRRAPPRGPLVPAWPPAWEGTGHSPPPSPHPLPAQVWGSGSGLAGAARPPAAQSHPQNPLSGFWKVESGLQKKGP